MQVARHPGQQSVEHTVVAGVAGKHGKHRTTLQQLPEYSLATAVLTHRCLVGFIDMCEFRGIHARVFGRVIADVPPGPDTCQHGTDPGDDECDAPGVEPGDQPRNDDCAKRCTQRCAAIHQGGATTTFVGGQPGSIELGASRHDRRLGDSQANACDQQRDPVVRTGGQSLECAPADRGDANDGACLEAIQQHSAGNLHQRIRPEEGTEHQALESRRQLEFGGDQWQRHR
ncbi:hypothetical protein D9M69_457840 [compost metagenome]